MNYEQVKLFIEDKDFGQLRKILAIMQAADIAELLDELEAKTAILVFRLLPKELAVKVFSYISHEQQSQLSILVNEKELTDIINDLYFDDKIDYLEEMPAYVVKKILKSASETERRLINQFLNYPDNSAGSLMTIEFVDLEKEMTIKKALEKIREIALDKETIYTSYVIDEQRRLEGMISLRELVVANPNEHVKTIMHKGVIYVSTHDDQENVADIFKKYDLLALPVVDHEKRLVGIITIDDIVDVIEQENTEDFHKMAALVPSDEAYLSTSVYSLARKRIVWLLILMVSAIFTGYIIKNYEETLQSIVVLAAFIPMLMDAGGNAGSQASTLVIRGIVLGEIENKDLFKVIWKETRVSLIVGIIMAIVNFISIYFLQGELIGVAITVSITLIVTVTLAKTLGGVLPIIAKSLKLDPAVMAGPLITTIVDTIALLIYFYIATILLGI